MILLFCYMRKMKRLWIMILLALLMIGEVVWAAEIELPASLRTIEDYAFAGNTSMCSVNIPETVKAIGECAFRDCTDMGKVLIGNNVNYIGENAFDNCAEDILFCTQRGSFAASYAVQNSIDYQAGTVYRALLIGNSYSQNRDLRLLGPDNDVKAMKRCLIQFTDTPYEVYTRLNLNADEILKEIDNVFCSVKEEDVTLLYYSGHGLILQGEEAQSALLGNDGDSILTAEDLHNVMDNIPGRKIIVIDSCFSGGFIRTKEATSESVLDTGNNDPSDIVLAKTSEDDFSTHVFLKCFVNEFIQMKKRDSESDRYFILTSAASDEKSFESLRKGFYMGNFTSFFVEGCGWDVSNQTSSIKSADVNDNGVITFEEAFRYTEENMLTHDQHVQAWPYDCRWFGMLRQ